MGIWNNHEVILIPVELREKYSHLAYGEMAEVPELAPWAALLRRIQAELDADDKLMHDIFDKPSESPKSSQKQKPVNRVWNEAALKSLLKQSLEPGITHESLGKEYGVTRQRISALLKDAREKFSTFLVKPSLLTSAMDKSVRKKRQ